MAASSFDVGSFDLENLLAALYDQQGAAIYRFCLGMLGRADEAEDAVQQVWLKLAEKPALIEGAEDRQAYLWTVARNRVNSRLRRRLLERFWTPSLEPAALDPLPAPAGPDPLQSRELARAVGRLRPRLREIVLLVGIEGHTLEAAAALLAIPRGTAASRYHAAVEKLRDLLRAR